MPIDKKVVLDHILQIEQVLRAAPRDDVSLGWGASGTSLFYHQLFRLTGKAKYLNQCQRIIAEVAEKIEDLKMDYSLGRGAAGILWTLDYLLGKKVCEFDPETFFANLETPVYIQSLRALLNNQYDFLAGGVGPALHALRRRTDEKAVGYLRQWVKILDNLKMADPLGVRWEDLFSEKPKDAAEGTISNLGIAHGMTGIVNVLISLYAHGLFRQETATLITGSLTWLAGCKLPGDAGGALYPNYSYKSVARQRADSVLAWYTGDLGIGLTYWKAGQILANDAWKNEAVAIMEHAARQDLPPYASADTGIYQGSAGIAYLFGKFYEQTGMNNLRWSHEAWIARTLARLQAAGSRGTAPRPAGKTRSPDPYGLLTGMCGTGLVLIDALMPGDDDWDECLLLRMP